MQFTETRGNDGTREQQVPFSSALLSPIASYGGIYSPEAIPSLDPEFLAKHQNSHFKELALDLLLHLKIDIDSVKTKSFRKSLRD